MPILDESHDFMHPVEGDQAWSESYYFNCYDPGTDTGFFGRCGVRPNDGTLDIGLSFWLPGGGLARMGGVREQTAATGRWPGTAAVETDVQASAGPGA